MNKKELAIGIDYGGSNIKAILLEWDGETYRNVSQIEKSLKRSWKYSKKGLISVINTIDEAIDSILKETKVNSEDLSGIGIGLAAPISPEGVFYSLYEKNKQYFDCWRSFRPKFNTDFLLVIDVHAAALGEAYIGAGIGTNDFLYVAVGTGVGSGIIKDRKIFRYGLGIGSGLGHTNIIPEGGEVCDCRGRGCLETVCSAGAITKRAIAAIEEGVKTCILEESRGNLEAITPRIVYQAARKGDKVALKIFQDAGFYLGIAIANLVTVLSPKLVIVGGGISEAGDIFIDPVRSAVRQKAWPPFQRDIPIVQAKLGIKSGAYGAAIMAIMKDS